MEKLTDAGSIPATSTKRFMMRTTHSPTSWAPAPKLTMPEPVVSDVIAIGDDFRHRDF